MVAREKWKGKMGEGEEKEDRKTQPEDRGKQRDQKGKLVAKVEGRRWSKE